MARLSAPASGLHVLETGPRRKVAWLIAIRAIISTLLLGSAIVTEQLGCASPARPSKYFTRGPCLPMRVDTKIVPGIPVSSSGRFANTTGASSASSSASGASAGTLVTEVIGMGKPKERRGP